MSSTLRGFMLERALASMMPGPRPAPVPADVLLAQEQKRLMGDYGGHINRWMQQGLPVPEVAPGGSPYRAFTAAAYEEARRRALDPGYRLKAAPVVVDEMGTR